MCQFQKGLVGCQSQFWFLVSGDHKLVDLLSFDFHIVCDSGKEVFKSEVVSKVIDHQELGINGHIRKLKTTSINREMGYVIARKHSARLRRYAIVLNFVVPAVLLALVPDNGGIIGLVCAILAVAAVAIGIFIERWFFLPMPNML